MLYKKKYLYLSLNLGIYYFLLFFIPLKEYSFFLSDINDEIGHSVPGYSRSNSLLALLKLL